jgi:hypothetical protein
MRDLPKFVYETPNGYQYKTAFMHLFDMPEVDVIESPLTCCASSNNYVNMVMSMFYNELISIPYVEIYNRRGLSYYDLKKDYIEIPLHNYGSDCNIIAMINPKDLINYDMTKICKEVYTTIHFTWDKYKNRQGVITEIGKLKFLNDILKQKANATGKR